MKRGFSLLEIIFVIGIISILLTIGAPLYTSSQKNARDARRKQDLEEIRIALEQYRSNNNYYPLSLTFGAACSTSGNIQDANGNVYMTKIPKDPKCQLYTYTYTRISSSDYTLRSYLERGGTNCSGSPNCAVSGTAICKYCLGPYGQK